MLVKIFRKCYSDNRAKEKYPTAMTVEAERRGNMPLLKGVMFLRLFYLLE